MKIVIVVSDFPKVTETFSMINALYFMEQGHDVSVFHLKPFRTNEIVHDFAKPVIEKGFTFPWIWGASAKALTVALLRQPGPVMRHIYHVVRAFWKKPKHTAASLALVPKGLALGDFARREGVDHIHAEFAGYPATTAMLAASVSDVEFSFSAHAHDIFITQGLLARKSQRATFVRTISEFNKRFLSALPGFAGDKLRTIRCGIDPSRTVAPSKTDDLNRPMRILFVGSLYERKGVQHLMEALHLLDAVEWQARIVGGGPMEGKLREMAPDQVTFCGPQKAEAVRDAYDWADVVVAPSVAGAEGRSEGIPVVLMEALAHGCAVVTSRLSGIPELVKDHETGLLTEPGDKAALASCLTKLANDRTLARQLGQAGRELVLREYNIMLNAAQLLSAIETEKGERGHGGLILA